MEPTERKAKLSLKAQREKSKHLVCDEHMAAGLAVATSLPEGSSVVCRGESRIESLQQRQ